MYLLSAKYRSFALILSIVLVSCRYDKIEPDYNSYPTEIGRIMINRCAVKGCHNTESAAACAGLDLSSWDNLFKGSRNNSTVIPFRDDYSFLLYSINSYPELGPSLKPLMPLNKTALSKDEVVAIKNWIKNGAPDINGNIVFSGKLDRKKIYVSNQGCDVITVFDQETKLIMRMMDVGNTAATEAPHDMLISPDGKYLYVSFYASNIFQKYSTNDDVKVGELTLIDNSWHAIAISGNSKKALTSHLEANGKVSLIDLENMSIIVNYQGSNLLEYSHGCALNYDGTVAYITSLQSNFIYKVDLIDPQNPNITKVPLQTGQIPTSSGPHKPYEVDFFPDYSHYVVTCQGTNEVRVFQSSNDSLIKTITTSGVPQLVVFSKKYPYLFISNLKDETNPATDSKIDVVDLTNFQIVKSIFPGFQQRGITVDNTNNLLWVANRNTGQVGWTPHHTTVCAGKNGYVTIIDIATLELMEDWKAEVSVDPYSISVKE